jgi:hypothetical protein
MRNYLSIFFIILAFSCKDKSETLVDERKTEIERIVECVILQDSLNVFESDSTSIPLSKELKKLKVYSLVSNLENIPPKPIDGIYLNALFFYHLDIQFLPKKDSLSILNQNQVLRTYLIGNSFSRKIKLTTFKEQKIKSKANLDATFFYITIPIFSADNTKAYVEVNKISFAKSGWGEAIYLERKNGKWKIIYKEELWVS